MRRVYPAYARAIAAYIQRGQSPLAVGVMLSPYWRDFRDVPRACIRPDEWALGRFEFGWLQRQHVVAILGDDDDTNADNGRKVAELLCELMLVGPRAIWVTDVWGRWIENTGEPMRIEGICEEARLPASLVHDAAAVYRQTFHAARQQRMDVLLRYLEQGKAAPADGVDSIERRFGDPLWAHEPA